MRLRSRVRLVFAVPTILLAAAGAYGVSAWLKERPLPKEVPVDFSFSTSHGPCHADWGPRHFTRIRPSGPEEGNTTFELVVGREEPLGPKRQSTGFRTVVTHSSRLARSDLLPLYREIVRQKFFSLKERYWDPGLMDGGSRTIAVTASGGTHSVILTNWSLKETDRILARLKELGGSPD